MSINESYPIPLPKSISSSHCICKGGNDDNSDPALDKRYVIGCLYFEKQEYEKAREIFESCFKDSLEAKYQLAVMYYDGLGGIKNNETGVKLMMDVVSNRSSQHESLTHCAEYNLGRAYYEGVGVQQSDKEAEMWWLRSAQNGNPTGCCKAQSILGMFYSRKGEDSYDMKKAHYWHQEATANGSLESHGVLGVMYECGVGVKKDLEASFKCFKGASERGNVYAMGNLAIQYYKNKMFTNAAEVSKRVGLLQNTIQLSIQTNCLEVYIRKGIAMGCFIYARCLERGVVQEKEEKELLKWYSRAAGLDPDIVYHMKDDVTHGRL